MWTEWITRLTVVTGIIGWLALSFVMSQRNHQSVETPRSIVARQIVSLLAYGIVASVLVGGGQPLLQYFLVTN